MKKILLFPYHPDIRVLISHREYLHDYEICGVASFKEDSKFVQEFNNVLGAAGKSYDELLSECDAVILLDNYREYRNDKYYSVIEDAIKAGKELYITPFAETQLELDEYVGKYQILEKLPDNMEDIAGEYNKRDEFEVGIRVYDIETPIMAVLGQGKSCGKFETQLLTHQTLAEDFEVTTICTNPLGALFGYYTMPSFMYSETTAFQEKVVKFNYYVRKVDKEHASDVILLGIPEGIAPFKEKEYHHFAEYPLAISSAVSIDTAILCTYFAGGALIEDGLRYIVNYCKERFGIHVGAIAISRYTYDIPQQPNEKVTFDDLDDSFVEKYFPDLSTVNFPVMDLRSRENVSQVVGTCVAQLEENVSVV